MGKTGKTAVLLLAALGSAGALAVGFLKHNAYYWGALLFFAAAVLYSLDRPLFLFRGLGTHFPLTKEDALDILENHMLYGDPEKEYARLIRASCALLLILGWAIVLYGALRGRPL